MGLDPDTHSVLLCSLADAARAHPTADKLVVCRPRGVGRELLHSLARAGVGWVGFRVQTPFELATELAAASMARDGLRPVDRFDEMALLDQAIDAVLESRPGEPLRVLGEAVGFRNALAGSIREVRLAGLYSADLARSRIEDTPKRQALAAIQRAYETALHEGGLLDRADVLRRAVAAVDEGGNSPAPRVYLLPGMHLRGLRGELLSALLRRGASVLGTDPVRGLPSPQKLTEGPVIDEPPGRLSYLYAVESAPPPGAAIDLFTPGIGELEIELFAAASPVDELREVLRRVMKAGLPWDEVEIVSTDPVTYGTALDSVAPRLLHGKGRGSRVTHAAGLPVSRSRTGRVVSSYLRWIQEDFPEETVRALLQAEMLRPPETEPSISGPRLARTLRGLRIGWGRDRYLKQIDWALAALDQPAPSRDARARSGEKLARRREKRRAELDALRRLIEPVLAATPPTPDRLGAARISAAPAALAAGLLAMLDLVPDDLEVEREAQRRLREVLARIGATLQRETGFHSAVAIVQRLIDLRVPSPSAHGRVPWSSAGGYLHFSDLDHGGLSGRPHVFVVGLDAARFPGSHSQDPILLDRDRARLGNGALLRSSETLEEGRYALAALLARLRRRVTLSYSAWDASEGRKRAPSPVLLQALRLARSDPTVSYKTLHELTDPVAGPVPTTSGLLDDDDVWLDRMTEGTLLLRGAEVVRGAYHDLDRGLCAASERTVIGLNAHNGKIEPRPDRLDPRQVSELIMSASRLETLAGCPLQYFYKYVLGLAEPDEIEFQPDRWLEPKHRGSLFHNVYEAALQAARKQGVSPRDEAFMPLAEALFDEEVARTRHRVPIPSQAVYEAELRALRADLQVFLEMLAELDPDWRETEWAFGFGEGAEDAARLGVGDAVVKLRGAVDRIDNADDGLLRIVDYKTGGTWGYKQSSGIYAGGTRLQHALYTAAVEQRLGEGVQRAEYHFPTRKGGSQVIGYEREQLDRWPEILETLLDMVAAGHFPPPPDEQTPCRFCDFRTVCGVKDFPSGVVSPPAQWARGHSGFIPEFAPLLRLRKIDE